MQRRPPPEDPQNNVEMSQEEIQALSASLRTTSKTSRAGQVADNVTGVASGLIQRLLGLFRIPLTIVAGFIIFILIGGIADNTIIGRLGGTLLAIIVTWIVIGRIVLWLDIRQFRDIRR